MATNIQINDQSSLPRIISKKVKEANSLNILLKYQCTHYPPTYLDSLSLHRLGRPAAALLMLCIMWHGPRGTTKFNIWSWPEHISYSTAYRLEVRSVKRPSTCYLCVWVCVCEMLWILSLFFFTLSQPLHCDQKLG